MDDTERRRFLRAALAGAGLTVAGTAAASESDRNDSNRNDYESNQETTQTTTADAGGAEEAGLVTVESDESVGATVERIEEDIEDNDDLILVTAIDHARNAQNAGLDLRPTVLVLFGNPNLGTRLMQASQTAGIDLPQKLLVWEAEDGTVNVTYNDPAWLADRHDIAGQEEVLNRIADALETLATGG
ncbi:DUF302 domain-containing protein [Halorussus lipolyticus]|uniref:DUF302 domain-containing protein n=1 Tax=Halorussus lipolyticus TaxID=3034024 RepID=UPI0023E7D1BC|nr:DUF302 domain-containing protein [Halorussus sp. DT80]